MKLVYGISRWTNVSRASARHIDDGTSRPLCGGAGRKAFTWEREEGEPTCQRCIAMVKKRRNPTLSVPTSKEYAKFRVTTKLVRSSAYDPMHEMIISSPEQARDAVRRIEDAPTENLMALYLDTRNRVNGIQLISKGERASTQVPHDHVLRTAILTNSAGIVLVHNHPSDDPALSIEDIGVARRLKEGANLLGIEVLDMIALGGGKVHSARGEGRL